MNAAATKRPSADVELTRDRFLGGRVQIAQPKSGFRAGLDTVLLAASVNAETRAILDLGAGVGAASLCVMADLERVNATLVERQPALAGIAAQNLAHNGFSDRSRTLSADVTASGAARSAAGIKADFYTSVIANPPFFDTGAGTPAKGEHRNGSRHMPAADIDKWVKTAATSVAPGGEVIFIHTASSLPALLRAFDARFGSLCIQPIAPRPGADASRVLIRGIKGSGAPLRLLDPLILHDTTGNEFAPSLDAVFRGQARLDW